MNPNDILAILVKKEITLTSIAEQEGVSVTTISNVIKGKRTSHSIAYAISERINISTESMWPGKYLTPPAYRKARNGKSVGRLPIIVNASPKLIGVKMTTNNVKMLKPLQLLAKRWLCEIEFKESEKLALFGHEKLAKSEQERMADELLELVENIADIHNIDLKNNKAKNIKGVQHNEQ